MKSTDETTQGRGDGIALRERKRVLDVLTLAVLLAAFAAAAVPWVLRVVPMDLGPAARLTFLYVVFYLVVSTLADRGRAPWVVPVCVFGLQAAGLVVLGIVWQLVGGLQNPAFLLVFVPLVMADGLLFGRWPALLAAVASVGVVGMTALAGSVELRWYLVQLGLPAGWAAALGRRAGTGLVGSPLSSVLMPPGQQFLLLEGFGVFQLSAALISASLARALGRLWQRRRLTAAEPGAPSALFQVILAAAPSPTAVLTDDGCVILASDGFVDRVLLHGDAVAGRALIDLIAFDDPAAVRRMLAGEGGGLLRCRYRIGSEVRGGELSGYSVRYAGERFIVVALREVTELDHLQRALDGLEDPLLVVGDDGRVQFANPAAVELFGPLYFGADASAALARPELPAAWWNGGAPRTERLVMPRAVYRLAIDVVGNQDGREAIRLVRLSPEKRPYGPLASAESESTPSDSPASGQAQNGGSRSSTPPSAAAPSS